MGVGAQRSGTTWISRFLYDNPEVQFSPIKEICFFDSKHVASQRNTLLRPYNAKLALFGLGNYCLRYPFSGLQLIRHYLGVRALHDSSYRAFFDELACEGAVAGEICPSYAVLHEEAIRAMDTLLDQPNYFYIMRNPIDRLVSQYSFLIHRKDLGLKLPERGSLLDKLLWLCETSFHSNYHLTLKSYRAVVPETRFKVMFTEHLFDPLRHEVECDSLCDFLGIGCVKAPIEKAVNRAPEISIDSYSRAILAAALTESYQSVAKDFAMQLPDNWQQDLLLTSVRA